VNHHETPTARALKLTVHMIAVLFGSHTLVNPASRKALVSRGLVTVAGTGIALTDAGREAMDRIETEVLDQAAEAAPCVAPAITVELPSGESLEVPPMVVEEETSVPVRRTIRARDVKPGMTIGVVQYGEPDREVIVTDVREIGSDIVIHAGSVEVRTGSLTLFSLLNDGSLFESDPVAC